MAVWLRRPSDEVGGAVTGCHGGKEGSVKYSGMAWHRCCEHRGEKGSGGAGARQSDSVAWQGAYSGGRRGGKAMAAALGNGEGSGGG